jgi:ribosomal protein S18 acetylase RimI-like enzyme
VPQPAGTDAALLERCFRFELELEAAASERIVELGFGRVLLDSGIPEIFSANCLIVEDQAAGAGEVAAAADRVLGGEGMRHRCVAPVPAADTDRLAEGLGGLGWQVDTSIYMALERPPAAPPDIAVGEVPFDDVAEARREVMATGRWGDLLTGDAGEQMLSWDRRLTAAGSGRWFAARTAGSVASYCVLYGGDGVGQVETVGTVPAARGGGLARAVTSVATAASVERGDRLTFIVADADDWPHRFYERLGYRALGTVRSFIVPGGRPDP